MLRKNNTVIAIDCMGGDNAPSIVIQAVSLISNQSQNLHFLLYGKKEEIDLLISHHKKIITSVTVIDTDVAILATDKPSVALRKKKSSMHAALRAVADRKASCIISAGNTGALMAIARLILGTLPNINRPAIVTSIPTNKNEVVFLDLGANVKCDHLTLHQFALMGKAFSQAVFDKKNPSVALLNIGSEKEKGTPNLQAAYSLIQNSEKNINFYGYIEADRMFDSDIDVVVADGFCGNIMLKTAEGMFTSIKNAIQDSYKGSIFNRIRFIFVRHLLKNTLQRFNPKLRNGAMFVGLNGIVIKSHGNANASSFANAIHVAISAVQNEINNRIKASVNNE